MRPVTGNWFVGIIGADGREMTQPHQRQTIAFRASTAMGMISNANDHVFTGLVGTATAIGLFRDNWTTQVDLTCSLTYPATMAAGCELRLPAGGLSVSDAVAAVARKSVQVMSSLDEWMKTRSGELPPTPKEIWDAAFVAGHSTAYTLMTGDTP